MFKINLIMLLGLLTFLLSACRNSDLDAQPAPIVDNQPPVIPTETPRPTPTLEPTDTSELPTPTSPLPTSTPAPSATPAPTATYTPIPTEEPVKSRTQANADVLYVKATETEQGVWRFDVTVQHPDTGWEDYADGWDVILPDGSIIKPNASDPFTRLLLHPHENEQPFTRSQSNILIPLEVTVVTVRAHDLVEGWGGQEIVVDLSQEKGEGFEVVR